MFFRTLFIPSPERMRHPSLRGRIGTLLTLVLTAGFAASARAEVTKEYQLKAAFLYNFTRFVEWRAAQPACSDQPFIIGLWGENPFGGELNNVIEQRKVNGRPIKLRLLKSVEDSTCVSVAFFGAGEARGLQTTLQELHRRGVLTVGESTAFSAASGVITFVRERDKVRFEINVASSEEAGLKISAQLLKLAANIYR